MKKIIACVLLPVLIITGVLTSFVSMAAQPSVAEIANAAAGIIQQNEGSYTSVNKDDNGALSVGWLQWHATRALNLLQSIVAANPNNAYYILGNDLFLEIRSATSWQYRIATADEAAAISKLLGTPEGRNEQDALANNDITAYVRHGISLGITSPTALVYFADMENQCGGGGAARVAGDAYNVSSDGIITLEILHNTALRDSVAGRYSTRRNKVYNYAILLGWDDNTPGNREYEVWMVATGSLNIRTGPGAEYERVGAYSNGTMIVVYEKKAVGSSKWGRTPVGWVSLDYCEFQRSELEYKIAYDLNGGTVTADKPGELTVTGINTGRGENALIIYNSKWGESTLTNSYGTEAAVDSTGKIVTGPIWGGGNFKIPTGGFVVSAHGSSQAAMGNMVNARHYLYFNKATMKLEVYSSKEAYIVGAKTYYAGKTLGELPVPTREGYTFNGWHTESGELVTDSTVMKTCDTVTLTAYWAPAKVKMIYDAGEGTLSTKASATVDGINVGRGTDMLVVYNSEKGETTGTNSYGSEATVDATGHVTEINSYISGNAEIPTDGFVLSGHSSMSAWIDTYIEVGDIVTFDEENMTVSVSFDPINNAPYKSIYYGCQIGTLAVPELNGAEFLGWYTAKTDGYQMDMYAISDYTSDFTVYAHYKVKETEDITLSFDANGGTGAPDNVTADAGSEIIIANTKPTMQCKTFAGWSTEPNGEVVYLPGDTYTGGSATLYAVWKSEHEYNSDCKATLSSVEDGVCTYTYICNLCSYEGTFTRAAEEVTLNADLAAAQGLEKSTYILNVDLSSAVSLKKFNLVLNYGAELTYNSYTASSSVEQFLNVVNGEGTVTVTVDNENGFTAESCVLTLIFSADKASDGCITVAEINAETIEGLPANTVYTLNITPFEPELPLPPLVPTVPGDVNGDGKVTLQDIIKFKIYYKGLCSADGLYPDVNGDGKITLTDLIKIKMYYKQMAN